MNYFTRNNDCENREYKQKNLPETIPTTMMMHHLLLLPPC